MTDHLAIIVDGRIMGEIRKDKRARLTLAYDADWRQTPDAYPLSLSMPLVVAEHEHAKIEPWLWGLLPDNEAILARWGQRFQVSPRNPFALLAHVGEDCAGAIQIVQPERADVLRTQPAGKVEWLNDKDIAERIRTLRKDHAAWRIARDSGQFSLAGAQPKTAFLFEDGRWGVPSGRIPTTHIVKPPIEAFDGHAENEHVCLALARALRLPAAASQVCVFEGEVAIVVERYDRVSVGDTIRRLHQEDMCQALGLPPTRKYENEGGPGAQPIVELLRTYSSRPIDDVWTFIQAIALNWIIGGTDAHAKNYSVLIGAGGRARLAPLYDIASTFPYDFDFKKLNLAMKIGGKYLLDDISLRHWNKLASSVRLGGEQVRANCLELAERLPDALADVIKTARADGLDNAILQRLSDVLTARAADCRKILMAAPAPEIE
ncbi:type II toxin-antitoxin system HipA family toxin [Haematospirillum jordaniae]|uniref:type II toxin-antitoxin system HipA family toxin n=1 Tax=Haematospirillum jordaniae TaxID=1549855 RepID=UPI001432DC4C|nr:type II toxin-antitoxin system HipA family toxin [Haematospirillum jordaniae]NKD84401.1 type II toxin-antitoxin system HipA family toxin [Haematospirillum jordaniae]